MASHAAMRSLPGTGAPSSPRKPLPPRLDGSPRSGASAAASIALVAWASRSIRSIGHRMSTCGWCATSRSPSRAQPSRANIDSCLACTVASNRSTLFDSASAAAARTSAGPTPRVRRCPSTTSLLPVHQPRSGSVAGASRTPPSTVPSASSATSTLVRGSSSM